MWSPGREGPLEEGHGKPLQDPWLKNPTDRGAWWAMVPGVTQSDTTVVTDHARTLKDSKLTVPDHICFQIVCCNHRRRQWHPLQYSCLENPMDGGAWWAAVHGVAKSRTWLRDFTFTFHFLCIGGGNGNPLQCSCLENPMDGIAWWAAIYGVAQSRTWLKWCSSSSSCNHTAKCKGDRKE